MSRGKSTRVQSEISDLLWGVRLYRLAVGPVCGVPLYPETTAAEITGPGVVGQEQAYVVALGPKEVSCQRTKRDENRFPRDIFILSIYLNF